MDEIPLWALGCALFVLILLSGFFSGSETGLTTLNRYRLRHLAESGHQGARLASRLLERPDRLIGLILLGNNFVNILASALATVLFMRLLGEAGIMVATTVLTVVILIFAEVLPKTLAALHPERVAFPAAYVYSVIKWPLAPFVVTVNFIVNAILRRLGVSPEGGIDTALNREELRTVVMEAGAMIPRSHQKMLLSILDLEKVTVDDIMIPRNEIVGSDLEDDWERIAEQLRTCQYTRVPAFREDIDNAVGLLHLRKALPVIEREDENKEALVATLREPYFIPEGTPLHTQLHNFRKSRRRIGLVVNEYGDIRGLVTLEDILEEIVGEFTTDPSADISDITPDPEEAGALLVDGGAYIRELNRAMHWELPVKGPKTLNGLILEYLEIIPEPGTSFTVAGYPMEIVQIKENAVKAVRIRPDLRRPPEGEE